MRKDDLDDDIKDLEEQIKELKRQLEEIKKVRKELPKEESHSEFGRYSGNWPT